MVKSEEEQYSEVVIVVEATANMVSHWETIKKQYITPALNQFNQRIPSSGEDFIFTESKNRYGLVLFHAADVTPNSTTQCIEPTKNLQTFQKLLNSIQFCGGGGEHFSFVAEGLATALQLFEDFKTLKRNPNTGKYCFLISNTPPYQLPTFDSYNYSGKTFLQLAESLAENDVHLSVICPRFISDLQQIYLKANNNQQQLMNYAQDKRHLVLISGFKLATERDPVPIVETVIEDDITFVPPASVERTSTAMEISTSSVDPVSTSVTLPNPSLPQSIKVTQVNSVQSSITANPTLPTSSLQPVKVPITRPVTNINPIMVDNSTPFSQSKPMLSTSQIPEPQMSNNSVYNQPMSTVQTQSVAFSSNATHMPTGQPMSTVTHPSPINTQLNQPRQVTQVEPTTINMKPVPQQPEGFLAAKEEAKKVKQLAEASAKPLERKPIWSGTVEWQEKRLAPTANAPNNKVQIKHSSPCQILVPINSPQMEINTSNWPHTVLMQNIPQQLITNQKCQTFLRLNRTVHFRFPPANQPQLVSMFAKKTCGLVNINLTQPTKSKIIIALFLKHSTAAGANPDFVGVMPNDTNGLLNAMRNYVASAQGLPPQIMTQQQPQQDLQPQPSGMASISNTQSIQPTAPQVNYNNNPNQFRQSVPRQTYINQQQPISYQANIQTNPQMNVVSSRINQPMNQNQTVMGNNIRTINIQSVPQQVNRNIPMQQGIMQNQQGNIRNINPSQGGMSMGINNMAQNVSMNAGQRVLTSAQTGMPMSNPNNHSMMNMQQMQQQNRIPMRSNRPTGNEQLRHLLRDNSQGQGPGMMNTQGMRQPNNTMPQQQNFMRNNMGQGGLQNQRHF